MSVTNIPRKNYHFLLMKWIFFVIFEFFWISWRFNRKKHFQTSFQKLKKNSPLKSCILENNKTQIKPKTSFEKKIKIDA